MTAAGPAGAPAGYLRSPAIRAGTIVFVCEDDLWSVPAEGGPAERLTAGVSEAGWPAISPDGSLVAFVGADDGPAEPYVLPRSGGPARRLAYQAATACRVLGWHPDGDVVYASSAEQPPGFGTRLFAVPPGGGRPRVLPYGPAAAVSFGADGGVAVGRSIADPARRKRYRGGAAGEIWLDDGDGRWRRLAAGLPGNLADPCRVGDRVYFISDHERVGNVYSVRVDGSGLRRHSDHDDFYARALSTDGARLVYQSGAGLHLIDPGAGDRSHPVEVRLAGAAPQRRARSVPASGHLEHARLSPDGEVLAVVSRGQVFSLGVWSGPVRTHGRPAGVRHRRAEWLSDGRLVAVAADDSPFERLVILPAEGGPGHDVDLGDVGLISELVTAPTTGRVAFATNRHQVWVLDADPVGRGPARPRLVDSSPHERIEDLAWSPDGRWLAYTCPTSIRTSAIRVADAEGGQPFAVTEPVLIDCRPVFDPGGRYLYFLGQRDLTPELDQVRAGVGFPFGARPYAITLRAGDPPPFTPPPGRSADLPAAASSVRIDRAGIERRVVAFPVPEGRYADVVALEDRVLLVTTPVAAPDPAPGRSGPDGRVLAVPLDGSERPTELLDPLDELSAAAGGRALLGRWRDRLRVLPGDVEPGDADEDHVVTYPAGRVTGWVDLDRVRVRIDPSVEWQQMFREAWRLQREGFWAPGLPGVGWDDVFDRYRPLAERVATRRELSDLLWELQGELATSHAYEFGGEYRRPEGGEQDQGFLGIDFAPGAGPWRVGNLLLGDPWDAEATSPCRRPGVDVRPGDRLLAVDGRPVGPAGPGELLVGLAGREVELTVQGPGGPARRAVVRAARQEDRARYLDWVAANRRQVHALSDGRLGYLHVPDMFATGYRDFVRGFLAELDREGLVVDVRFNGGGHVSPLLLDQLGRRRSGVELGRWGGSTAYPAESPAGPMAAVINEQTGSDAELFAHRFRALGLGPLVGRRTWGGVVATWPRHTLVDGTVTTQPEFRHFLDDVGDRLENRGVDPDVVVEALPGPPPGADPDLVAVTRLLLGMIEPPALTPEREGAGAT